MYNRVLLEAYRPLRSSLSQLGERLCQKLEQLIRERGLKVHDVSWRLKSEASLARKLARPDKIYRELSDIMDLIGLRVVTYFEDTIEAVAHLVEENFTVDFEHSVDKRWAKDPQSFGYRSLHYVCQLHAQDQLQCDEGAQLPFEIQIRSILQHAWAEIEHDLGYKFPEAIPQPVRRRFSRLAGLLELADEEFVALRRLMEEYEREVAGVPSQSSGVQNFDVISLRSLVENPRVRQLDRSLAAVLHTSYSDSLFYPDYMIRLFRAAGFKDTQALLAHLESFAPDASGFMERYFRFTQEAWGFHGQDLEAFQSGYSLFLLAHAVALKQASLGPQRIERMQLFFQEMDYPDQAPEALRVARLLVKHCADWKGTA